MDTKVINVKGMRELESGSENYHWFWARGHYDLEEFATAVNRKFGVCINPAKPEHTYMRWLPWDKGVSRAEMQKQPGRGAFPVTIIDVTARDSLLEDGGEQ